MAFLRYPLKTNLPFYLLIAAYSLLIARMTMALWFGDGINVFESYSDATTAEAMLVDANFVYWSKTCFLFLTMLMIAANFDGRFAIGLGCSFWAISLSLMFGASPVLLAATAAGVLIVGVQIKRGEVLRSQRAAHPAEA